MIPAFRVLITTSRDPSSRLTQFAKELKLVFPNAQRINRGSQARPSAPVMEMTVGRDGRLSGRQLQGACYPKCGWQQPCSGSNHVVAALAAMLGKGRIFNCRRLPPSRAGVSRQP